MRVMDLFVHLSVCLSARVINERIAPGDLIFSYARKSVAVARSSSEIITIIY